MIDIAVAVTCHNRVEVTLNCLRLLQAQQVDPGVKIHVVLVDDGSSDGTADDVSREFPDVMVLRGNGSLYWNRGMRLACARAIEQDPDFLLWLNDDTRLFPDAIQRLVHTFQALSAGRERRQIVVGALRDPDSHLLSYGGWHANSRMNPAACSKIDVANQPIECSTMNGNCVLISREAFSVVGNLDPKFRHAMGDFDYGFRARYAGCRIWVAAGFVGDCRINNGKGLWSDQTLSWRERWRRMMGPKGLPPREWLIYTRRHSGPFWLLYWINPYVRFLVRMLYEHLPFRERGRVER